MKSLRTTLTTTCLAALAAACSEDPSGDANDAGTADVGDAGDVRDADASATEDVGVPDVGNCGCTYGFHQACSEGELCVQAYSDWPICTRTMPSGGCALTSTVSPAAPCNAQCAVVDTSGTACRDEARFAMEYVTGEWYGAIGDAIDRPGPEPWRLMEPGRIPQPQDGLSQACIDFIGWTAIAVAQLCGGPDTIRHQAPWDAIENRLFRAMTSPADDCQLAARRLCVAALEDGVRSGESVVGSLNVIPNVCPDGLPFAAPCDGADGLDCVKRRLAPILRVVHRPF
jgi:hypothetical protein